MKYYSLLATYTWKHWLVTYALVALFSFAPLLSVIIGSLLGRAFGCEDINEGSVPNCPGGDVVYTMLVIGWFGLVTFPLGGFIGIVLVIGNVLWYFTRQDGADQF